MLFKLKKYKKMLKIIRLILAAVFLMASFGAQAKALTPQIKANSIGAVYFVGETSNTVTLKVVFTLSSVDNYPVELGYDYHKTWPVIAKGAFKLFDDKGVFYTPNSAPEFKLVFWCENDGGMQFRPQAELVISKKALGRKLQKYSAMQGIVGFMAFNVPESTAAHTKIKADVHANVRVKGSLAGDGTLDAVVYAYDDDAQNCDGKPANNLGVVLKTAHIEDELRCCGP
jgi:hypothetical protein